MKEEGALMHVYVLEHIVSLCYKTAWWMFTKLGREDFSANPAQGWIQGGAKKVNEGSLLQRTASSDWKASRQNECIAMI